MRKNPLSKFPCAALTAILILLGAQRVRPQSQPEARVVVHADRPGPRISPTLFGIFFEEINHAGDGGLYAELIRNRSFEESTKPVWWKLQKEGMVDAEMSVDSMYSLSENNRHYLRLKVLYQLGGNLRLVNEGYGGIPVQRGSVYSLSLYAMAPDGLNRSVYADLVSREDETLASARIDSLGSEWSRHSVRLVPNATSSDAQLVIRVAAPGEILLDVVSLFPEATYKGRPNGLRNDLALMLQDLRPSFVRFPGGCWVEGDNLGDSFRWKQTIGDISDRRYQYDLWRYYSTNGLGFHEYLQLCEDLKAAPLFVINCGMSHHGNVPLNEMKPWIQDALDAIEYANGPVDSYWGSMRAGSGHPAPFNLKHMEIGNENGGAAYAERFALFYDAIKAKYPDVTLIADVWGGYPKNRRAEMIDEHYYSSAKFFMENADRYDKYDRKGPKIYVGEYAVTEGCGNGNLHAALGEAAFMTGLERNADIVSMASYAPLFANVQSKTWSPDLINFDGIAAYGTPSYYVQQLFSGNRGDVVLPIDLSAPKFPAAPLPARNGRIGLGTWNTQAEFKQIRVEKNGAEMYASDFSAGATGWSPLSGKWQVSHEALQQVARGTDQRIVVGDSLWDDYTYTLKARKLGGDEGFLVIFSYKNNDNWAWWNIGGWGNTMHAVEYRQDGEKEILGKGVAGSVQTGRSYDIRIEIRGQRVLCYLDGQLVHDLVYAQSEVKPLYAVASGSSSTGEIILKVVNVSEHDIATRIQVNGVSSVGPGADSYVLTSSGVLDENTLSDPRKVVPRKVAYSPAGRESDFTFVRSSLTVLRFKSSGK